MHAKLLQNGHFRHCLRIRIGAASAPFEATCQLQHRHHAAGDCDPCGQNLKDNTGLCTQPSYGAAAASLRLHRGACTAFVRARAAVGADADCGRVPHLSSGTLPSSDVAWGPRLAKLSHRHGKHPRETTIRATAQEPQPLTAEQRKEARFGSEVRALSLEVCRQNGTTKHCQPERERVCLAEQVQTRARSSNAGAQTWNWHWLMCKLMRCLQPAGLVGTSLARNAFTWGEWAKTSTAAGGEWPKTRDPSRVCPLFHMLHPRTCSFLRAFPCLFRLAAVPCVTTTSPATATSIFPQLSASAVVSVFVCE